MFFTKQTISQLTPTGSKLSERTNSLINKNIRKLEKEEIAFLIREQIAIGVCLPIAIHLLKQEEINISMLHRNTESEKQRELIRELLLLDNWYWDSNSIANQQLKEILGLKINYINLSKDIKENFKNYQPQDLIWNEKSIQNFNAYMNDSRMGVIAGYGMVTRLKRAILNGNYVNYQIAGKSTKIQTVEKFEEYLVSELNCNQELLELLSNQNKILF